MKFEDIEIDLSPKEVDEKNWNKEQWVKDNPVDYFKYMKFLLSIKDSNISNVIMQNIYKIMRLYLPNTIFKYTSLNDDKKLNNIKLEALANKKIYLSDLKDFNDPFDGKGYYYISSELSNIKMLKHIDGKLIGDFSAYTKCASFTANGINSMPMWAHYGGNHQGFCVSYEIDQNNIDLSSNLFPVQYIDERVDITSYMKEYATKLCEKIENSIKSKEYGILIEDLSLVYMSVFFTNLKHKTWSYEKEFRCVLGAKGLSKPYIDAYPKEIYVGMNCESEYIDIIRSISKLLNVPIYQMQFDDYQPEYNLRPVIVE